MLGRGNVPALIIRSANESDARLSANQTPPPTDSIITIRSHDYTLKNRLDENTQDQDSLLRST